MSRWSAEKSIEVIDQPIIYWVGDDGVVGIRSVNDRFEVVFNDGGVVSIPACQAIVEYKAVSREEYITNVNVLRQPIIADIN